MVRSGWALAYLRYSRDYVEEEAAARADRAGIHRGEFIAPWDWRGRITGSNRLGGADSFAGVATDADYDVAALAGRILWGDDGGLRWRDMGDSAFGIDGRVGASWGAAYGSLPGLSATYAGSLLATDDAGAAVSGIARLDYRVLPVGLDTPFGGLEFLWHSLDVMLLPSGRDAIAWPEVRLRDDGFEAEGLSGRFYGAGGGQAGGVFRRDGLVGAFGAARRPATAAAR